MFGQFLLPLGEGVCGAVVLSIVIKLTVSGAPERFPKSEFFARMGGLARD